MAKVILLWVSGFVIIVLLSFAVKGFMRRVFGLSTRQHPSQKAWLEMRKTKQK
ncbi:MAG: hypothetical protein RML40_11000 [Bacteroidota bacterium]|nr:hypothetical protein [Candidatus Kapabacteria bacterium]MDW8221042.1 hypothetical protein [Bacteroidota bacterium]